MGCDYYAKAVIGIKLPDEADLPRATRLVRKKAFDHQYTDLGPGKVDYDPKTGQKLFLDDETEEFILDYPAYTYADYNEPKKGQTLIKSPLGFKFTCGTDGKNTCLGFVINTGSSYSGDDYGFSVVPDILTIRNELQKLLEPFGLWNEHKFGIHVILECSY